MKICGSGSKFIWLAFLAAAILFACSKKKETPSGSGARIRSVCIYDGIGLRGEPSKTGKWLSTVNLGETVYWIGSTRIDSTDNNTKYVNVVLSDSTEGWALEFGIATNATVGAIREDVPVYKRPDPLTITDVRFKFMDLVAITSAKEGWFEVLGEKRAKKGWINGEIVATMKEDVTSAVLAAKKMKANDGLSEIEKIKAIIGSAPFPNSYFIEKLRLKIETGPGSDIPMDAPRSKTDSNTAR
jgi:hypothetical protein